MKLKTMASIPLILMVAALSTSYSQETGPFPRGQGYLSTQPGAVVKITPKLLKSIFVPLDGIDPTKAERDKFLKKAATALKRGESEQAQELYKLVLLLDINDIEANMALGRMLVDAKQYPEARKYFLRVLQKDPNHEKALMSMGKISFNLFKRSEAFEYFQEAAELNPGNMEALKYINYITGEDKVKEGLPEEYYTIPYSQSLTREELAALVYFRTDKLKAVKSPPQPQIITDIGGSWAEKYIRKITGYRVMSVYPNHTFQPRAEVNRGEFAQVIVSLLKGLGLYETYRESMPKVKLAYDDIDPFNNYYDAVKLVTDLEIIKPGQGGNFNLGQTVTGAMAVEYFDRLDRAARLLRAAR